MKLTPFGEAARVLRMRYDVSMKTMAENLEISSSHLSGIEYGEKTLSDRITEAAIAFFKTRVTADELSNLSRAAEQSKGVVNVSKLKPEARTLVAAFARRLQEGSKPTDDINKWLDSRYK